MPMLYEIFAIKPHDGARKYLEDYHWREKLALRNGVSHSKLSIY
ncbi:hypothetical protein [Candidatus Orientia mediorientalis]|nr:hypothetical protein [Candidatus Orientia mediorientalis]